MRTNGDSGRWNELNPDRVRAAQKRYATKRKRRRAELTELEKSQEDAAKAFKRLGFEDQSLLLEWIQKHYPADES